MKDYNFWVYILFDKRAWKYNLIETMNPNWQDLAEDLENNILYWKNKETV